MLSLDDILAAPSDPDELNKHLIGRGLIPSPIEAPPAIAPATVGPLSPVTPAIKPMMPPTTMTPRGHDLALGATIQPNPAVGDMEKPVAPELGGPTPGAGAGSIVKPMVPPTAPTGKESVAAGMALHPLSAKEEGKRQFHELRPQLTADPGSAEYSHQKLAQIEFDKAHPWGGDISAHPGLLGKIGHIAAKVGNIAGDVLAPGVMANIPGTDINKQIQEADTKRELTERTAAEQEGVTKGLQQEEAKTRDEEAKTKLAKEQNEQNLEKDSEGNITGWKDAQGKLHGLDEEGTPQGVKDIAEATQNKPHFEKSTNGDIVQVTPGKGGAPATSTVIHKGDPKVETDVVKRTVNGQEHNILIDKQKGTDIKDLGAFKAEPNLANELRTQAAEEKREKEGEKWVTGEDENGKTVMVPKSQAKELGLKNLAEANADDVNKTKAARHVLPLLYNNDPNDPGVMQMIDNLDKKGKLGPLASRWNDFQTRKFGMDDPDYAALRGRMDLATTKLMQAHVGSRGGSFMLEHFENIANARKMGAADLRAGVDQELRYIHDISQQPSKKKGGPEKTEKAGGAEFKAPEGAPSAEKVPDGKVLKDGTGKVIARAKGGKWQAP